MHNIFLIPFILFFHNYCSKNIVFPFKKMTIEDFNGEPKTINDLLTFNIYTNISMGTPPQNVAHFINQDNYYFYYKNMKLSYNDKKFNDTLEEKISNIIKIWLNEKNSSTFICEDDYELIYSDYFFFQNLNKSITKIDLEFNLPASYNKYKYGFISFKNPVNPYYDSEMYFMSEIKRKDLIDEYYFTILYEENNSLFNYNNNLNLGTIIIGESPHHYNPSKFKEEDEEKISGNEFTLFINEVKFNSPILNFSESDIQMRISFTSGFIKANHNYRNNIEKLFFSELIKDNLCKTENLEENVYISQHIVYSCINNKKVQEQIKLFPTLYFEIKPNNLTFFFTYKEMFQLFNDRLYFLITFKDDGYSDWTLGELFLRKYLTSFNYDSKTISFYRSQVDEINKKSEIPNKEKKKSSNFNFGKFIRIIIEIIMVIVIIIISALLIRKYKNSRKKHANELKDDDYDYTAQENEGEKKINNEI